MIYLATDHRGYELKEKIKGWLQEWELEFEDMGAFELDKQDDYPDFVSKAAEKVSQDSDNSKAIILGASGQGEAIVANRYKNVRAIVFYGESDEMIKLSREHNDANILSLGVAFVGDNIKDIIKLWLETDFSGEERHRRRIEKMDK